MQPAERQAYDRHLDSIRIQNDILSSAKEEGLTEGKKGNGISADIISACTGLTIEEIEKL